MPLSRTRLRVVLVLHGAPRTRPTHWRPFWRKCHSAMLNMGKTANGIVSGGYKSFMYYLFQQLSQFFFHYHSQTLSCDSFCVFSLKIRKIVLIIVWTAVKLLFNRYQLAFQSSRGWYALHLALSKSDISILQQRLSKSGEVTCLTHITWARNCIESDQLGSSQEAETKQQFQQGCYK